MDHASLKALYSSHGQAHIFGYFDSLSAGQQNSLLSQAASIDLDELDRLVEFHVRNDATVGMDYEKLEPAPYLAHFRNGGDREHWIQARDIGEQALRDGRVGVFTVAGGQGTRLGYDAPKGTFPVTPVTHASLFEVFAGKLRCAGRIYGKDLHWFIMTSEVNHDQTVRFFEQRNYLGLRPDNVHFFRQGLMPAVDFQGKLIMESPGSLAMSPDGHGGSLRALFRSGSTRIMRENGIDLLSYFQVDNPLVKCVDPYFIGFHIIGGSEMSGKALPKAYPDEKVGHFCNYDNKTVVVEYSDLPPALQQARLADGSLKFSGGSIAIHVINVDFVERVGSGTDPDAHLPFHKAIKKIPYCAPDGSIVRPDKPNGVKFEMFVFDALPFARNPILIETLRSEDFSPVKNAEGVDSPESCRKDQLRMAAAWLKEAGVNIETDESGLPEIRIEIDPAFAMDRETFLDQWGLLSTKPSIRDGLVISWQ